MSLWVESRYNACIVVGSSPAAVSVRTGWATFICLISICAQGGQVECYPSL